MRKTFASLTTELMANDDRIVTLLGDIGVYSFSHARSRFKNRVINLGILEQSMIGVAAGMSSRGLIPFVHTIAPFLVERAFEQLKIDFGYQELRGNFISVGASSDYSTLGATHHCPGDIALLSTIPGFQIIVPGHSNELKSSLSKLYNNNFSTYFRLSEKQNTHDLSNKNNSGTKVKEGKLCTVISIGPTLDTVIDAVAGLDVEVLYLYSLNPIDPTIFSNACASGNVVVVEPFYANSTFALIVKYLPTPIRYYSIGYPREFIRQYGSIEEHLDFVGLSSDNIRKVVSDIIDLPKYGN